MVRTLVDVVAAVFVACSVAVAISAWLAVRAARRRWRRWRSAMTVARQLRQAPSALAAVASLPVADIAWWAGQRDRHRMWRAVTAAERAVRAATSADAAVGDLATLTRHLRSSASAADALVRAGGRDSRRHVDEVVTAARDIQTAAGESLVLVAGPTSTGLADAVRVEVAALRHGIATARH